MKITVIDVSNPAGPQRVGGYDTSGEAFGEMVSGLKLGIMLIVICFLHSTTGYCLGYLVCRGLRMSKVTCRTIAFEVGMQNAGMGSAIAASLNKVATLGLAPIVFGPVMKLTASILANWWRAHPLDQKKG